MHALRVKDLICEPCIFPSAKEKDNSFFTGTRPSVSGIIGANTLISQNNKPPDFIADDSTALCDKQRLLISQIKEVIMESIYSLKEESEFNFSKVLSTRLQYEYGYLANLFSKDQGLTIEKFRITQKVERVKKFLLSDELSITRIALDMHYSSVGHLSNQFKKTTGLSPSDFKKLRVVDTPATIAIAAHRKKR